MSDCQAGHKCHAQAGGLTPRGALHRQLEVGWGRVGWGEVGEHERESACLCVCVGGGGGMNVKR